MGLCSGAQAKLSIDCNDGSNYNVLRCNTWFYITVTGVPVQRL